MLRVFVFIIVALLSTTSFGQNSLKRALFLGNSYTSYNNLPQLTAQIASSMNDTLITDSNTPGGYKLSQHNSDATSIAKIAASGWNFVVLQEQSQLPAFPDAQVQSQCFPYAQLLNDRIKTANPNAETTFYMTWGRQNGDAANCANFPVLCTYNGMDSLLRLRYMTMANDNRALVSPVGAVWRYIRQNYGTIELYQSDQSHPSLAGSYAAACTFYTIFFRKNPTLISFDGGVPTADAQNIRTAVKNIVFDHLTDWNVGVFNPVVEAPQTTDPTLTEFQVFPNPAHDTLYLKYLNLINGIEVIDINGKNVAPSFIDDKTLDISTLPNGTYLIRINNEAFAKFIKQ